jgi:hypothetical protein
MNNPRRLDRIAFQNCFEVYAKRMGLFLADTRSSESEDPEFWIRKVEYFTQNPTKYLSGNWIAFAMTASSWLDDLSLDCVCTEVQYILQ